jgi:hypothetical protein
MTIGETSFQRLLHWLDLDQRAAAEEYCKLHLILVHYFEWNDCYEYLADEVLDIVASKISQTALFLSVVQK